MLMVSRALLERIKLSHTPAYRLAITAGLHPSTLSKLMNGAERVRPDDPRIVAVGRQLGLLPMECFASDGDDSESI